MIRFVVGVLLLLSPVVARAQSEQQALVDRATLAAQEILNDSDGRQAQSMLRQARAVMICPRVFRAGFILGGEGGGCVLVARGAAGSWSYPAFYGMGAGSVGFQAGIQDSEIMMMVLTRKGLAAMIDNQFKIGANADVAFVTLGGGVEGATTAAAGADIVAYARTRGLFAGISLTGSLLGARSEWNRLYYGRDYATQQIVLQMEARNPGADPLRETLTRLGNGPATPVSPYAPLATGPAPVLAQPAGAPAASYPPPGYPAPAGGPQPLSPVQQQSLPPPH